MNTRGRLAIVTLVTLSACSTADTIVSVNISSTDAVGNPNALVVTITQAGRAPVIKEIAPPTRMVDGGLAIQSMFFERIQLPSSFEAAPAVVRVDAKDATGVYLSAETTVRIRPEGAVVAYVNLGEEPEPEAPDAGAGDSGAAGGGAGTAGSVAGGGGTGAAGVGAAGSGDDDAGI